MILDNAKLPTVSYSTKCIEISRNLHKNNEEKNYYTTCFLPFNSINQPY